MRRSGFARKAVAALAIALVAGAFQAPATGATSSSKTVAQLGRAVITPARPALVPSRTVVGGAVVAKGTLRARTTQRPVILQRLAGSTWVGVQRSRTTRRGVYQFRFNAPAVTTAYRVYATRLVKKRKRYPVQVSAAAWLTVVQPKPSVSFPLPSTALAGVPPAVVVTAVPARTGRRVVLERRVGSAWRQAAIGTQNTTGRVQFRVPIEQLGLGSGTFRVLVPASGSDATVASAAATINVGAAGAITAPAAGAPVTEEFPVRVTVDPKVPVTGVQLFVEGRSLPDAVKQSSSVWQATVDPTNLNLKRKHVSLVAVIRTAQGRGLTTSVPLTVDVPGGTGLPPGFRIDTVASGLELPTAFEVIDEHRTLVAEKSGLVKLVTDGVASTVLDLRDRVMDHIDAGLVGLVLDPDFATNGWFYLSYVLKPEDPDGEWAVNRVARYTLSGATAARSSEHVVLGSVTGPACFDNPATPDCLPLKGWMHTANDLMFEPDGSLLVAVGDGAGGDPARRSMAQRLDVLAGKVLRVDKVTGRGLPDNPFFEAGAPASNQSRVLAYGFRNPFRMARSPTGKLFVGDVGETTWEEIDRVEPGGNYGWPCFEGPDRMDDPPVCAPVVSNEVEHQLPVLKYAHSGFVGSLTLGVFQPDGPYPDEYDGQLFFADYVLGQIWTTDPDAAEPQSSLFAIPPGVGAPVNFGPGPTGNLRYIDIGAGAVREIVYDPDETSCVSGDFLAETFRDRQFTPESSGNAWVSSCVGELPSGPSLTAPNSPNTGEGWSMRWTGRAQLAPGTYRLKAKTSGTMTVKVNGVTVPDAGTFRVSGSDVNEATADVVVELKNNPAWDDDVWFPNYDWNYELGWERVGTAPEVTLSGIPQGVRVPSTGTLGWTVSATDAEDGKLADTQTSVKVALLHYGGADPHEHPSANDAGPTGSFTFDDAHAPGRILYRVTGVATDSSGWTAESEPVYVCLEAGDIGPCG